MLIGASTLSTFKTPDSGSQKSPPVANTSSSTTPSIPNSKHHDLLMSADLDLAYPVMSPIQALNARDLRSQASYSQVSASPPPEWVPRNATSLAENQRNALLIDCVDSKQVSSYAAAAKRGTITRGSSRGQGNMRGGRSTYGPTPSQPRAPTGPSNQAQYSNKSVEWVFPKTISNVPKARSNAAPTTNQAIQNSAPARPTAFPDDPSQHKDLTTVQLLQQAKNISGVVKMEVEVGRILIKTDSIQPTTLFADLGNSGLIFRSANLLRKVHFRCLSDPDIKLSCTETQYLSAAKERRYFNTHMDRAAAEAQGDIWWGIKLASTTASSKNQQGDWTAEEIVEAGVAQRLQAVAIEIVTQIDGIGAQIQRATTQALSRAARTESYRGSRLAASQAATFW
ncbi:MAG: hypothetical protein Q9180_002130 [Flavoplaca navasiana]